MVELTNARKNLAKARKERDQALSTATHAVTVTCAREFADAGKFAAYRVGSGAETAVLTAYGLGRGVASIPGVVASSVAEGFNKGTKGQEQRQQLEQQRQQKLGGPQ
jgi:hypothetical protein